MVADLELVFDTLGSFRGGFVASFFSVEHVILNELVLAKVLLGLVSGHIGR